MDSSLSPLLIQFVRERLLAWFRANGRDLPWRISHHPYEVWISEMMLQQTQVRTMLSYYHRWMDRFPNVDSIAAASQEEILRLWAGLGYYSRALHIHRTARILAEKHGGRLPANAEELLALPGIGAYTAGAILSIAFNKDCPVVDGNVERVFSRFFDLAEPVKEKSARHRIWNMAAELLPKGAAGLFNQALMDLGATACLPRNPRCGDCPLKDCCQALEKGTVGSRPVSADKKSTRRIHVAVGVLEHGSRILIQKRPPSGLMANLWEFPGGKVADGETPEEALVREFKEELELHVFCRDAIARINHGYTTFRVVLHAFRCSLHGGDQHFSLRSAVEARWVRRRDLDSYPFPAANRKLIQMLRG